MASLILNDSIELTETYQYRSKTIGIWGEILIDKPIKLRRIRYTKDVTFTISNIPGLYPTFGPIRNLMTTNEPNFYRLSLTKVVESKGLVVTDVTDDSITFKVPSGYEGGWVSDVDVDVANVPTFFLCPNSYIIVDKTYYSKKVEFNKVFFEPTSATPILFDSEFYVDYSLNFTNSLFEHSSSLFYLINSKFQFLVEGVLAEPIDFTGFKGLFLYNINVSTPSRRYDKRTTEKLQLQSLIALASEENQSEKSSIELGYQILEDLNQNFLKPTFAVGIHNNSFYYDFGSKEQPVINKNSRSINLNKHYLLAEPIGRRRTLDETFMSRVILNPPYTLYKANRPIWDRMGYYRVGYYAGYIDFHVPKADDYSRSLVLKCIYKDNVSEGYNITKDEVSNVIGRMLPTMYKTELTKFYKQPTRLFIRLWGEERTIFDDVPEQRIMLNRIGHLLFLEPSDETNRYHYCSFTSGSFESNGAVRAAITGQPSGFFLTGNFEGVFDFVEDDPLYYTPNITNINCGSLFVYFMASPILHVCYTANLVGAIYCSNWILDPFGLGLNPPRYSSIPYPFKAKKTYSRYDAYYTGIPSLFNDQTRLSYLDSKLVNLWKTNSNIEQIDEDSKWVDGYKFVRIKARRSFTCHGKYIEEGTLGGYITDRNTIKEVDPIWVEDGSYFYAFASGEILVESNSFVVIENLVSGRIRFTNTRIIAPIICDVRISIFYDVWLANSRISAKDLEKVPIVNQEPTFYSIRDGDTYNYFRYAEVVIVGESNKRRTCILDTYFGDPNRIPLSLAQPYILTTGLKHLLIYDLFIKNRKIKELYFHDKSYMPITLGSTYWTPETS